MRLVRRFSETRRPHPMGRDADGSAGDPRGAEAAGPDPQCRGHRASTRRSSMCMSCARTSMRSLSAETRRRNLTISSTSFGFKNGVPADADLVFDVRFLPNPHFVPEFRKLTGRHPKVAKYVRSFPQTQEFLDKATEMLKFLLPHYIEEGKSYLTVAFGCTGGQHRSVFIAEEMKKRLEAAGSSGKDGAPGHAAMRDAERSEAAATAWAKPIELGE